MDKHSVATTLAGMTSGLAPSSGVSRDQLDLLKKELSEVIPHQDISTLTAGSTTVLDGLNAQPGILDENLLRSFEEQLSNMPQPETAVSTTAELKVFRRELP